MVPRPRWFAACAAVATVALLTGCGADTPSASTTPITVGSKGFTESDILAAAYAEALLQEGFKATVRASDGSARTAAALRASRIDIYPEYTGTAWALVKERPPGQLAGRMPDAQMDLVMRAVETDPSLHGFAASPATNNVVMACTPASGIRSLADVAGHEPPMRLAGVREVFTRPDGARYVSRAYGFTLRDPIITGPDDRYAPIRDGRADCVVAYETDPEMFSLDLRVVADPKGVLDGAIDYRVFPLASERWWRGLGADAQARVQRAIDRVSARITTPWVVDAIRRVQDDGADAAAVARELLNVDVP